MYRRPNLKNTGILPLTLAFAFLCIAMTGLGQDFKFHQLTSDDILDNQSILTIAQDNENRLWFGGKGKLYVYDSRSIRNVFEYDSLFMGGEYLNRIAIDQNNNILLGSAYSLLIYSIDQQKYIVDKDQSLINGSIYDIKLWRDKAFVSSSKGLSVISYNKKEQKYTVEKEIMDQSVQTLALIQENTLMYSAGTQLFIKPLQDNIPARRITLPISNDIVTTIHRNNDEIWIGTHKNGIFIYRQNQLVNTINESNSDILSNNIRKIIKIHDDMLIGTLKGLTRISQDGHVTNFMHKPEIPWSISRNSIYDLYVDDQEIIWVGTYFGGINAIYPNSFPIRTWNSQNFSQYRLQSEIISSVAEDRDRLYIGTEETGLQMIDKASGKSTNIPVASNLVKALLLADNKLYIGQHNGGLSILNLETNELKNNLLTHEGSLLKNNINIIERDTKGNIYLGTDYGVFLWNSNEQHFFEETKNRIAFQFIDNGIDGIYTNLRGVLWFKGYEQKQFKPITIDNLEERINQISPHENGDLWISTDHQIYLLNNRKAVPIYENSAFLFGSILHLQNHLWIGSNKGLLRYDLDSKRLHVFTIEDGLTTNSLQNSHFYKNNKNEVYLTSLKGVNIFNPYNIKLNDKSPSVLLSKFSVFSEEVFLQKEEKDGFSYQIKLPYDQNYFTIDFASSNFIKPQKNNYRYKLEGFDKEWKETSYPTIRYMNIPPGEYTMWMVASNNDGIWSETPLGLYIKITPPFWKTWWAYILYTLLFCVAILFLIKFIVEREVLINSEREHEKKIKFFTQISHEIRTPLTLITVPIEDIINSSQDIPAIHSKAKRLQKNANKLLSMVNELLDFKKIDEGKEVLVTQPVHLKTYLEEFFYLFSDLAIVKHLHFFIKGIEDIGFIAIDSKQFDKALFNLLSNAVKYSYEGGTVFLEAETKGKNYIIRIADNGIGLSANNQFKIFEEYYRDPKAQDTVGMGIGLALTKKIIEQHQAEVDCTSQIIDGQGYTVFSIKIPLKQFHKDDTLEDVNKEVKPASLSVPNVNGLTKETLLLVEDNHELSETIKGLFTEHYHVITAYDGEEGLAMALQYLPDIIISDVMMPKMNGIDMCEKVKSNTLTAHIPLILLTADTNESSHISGLKFGANVYLQKPFNTSVLLLTVSNLLQLASNKRKEFNIQSPNTYSEVDNAFIKQIETIIDENLLNNQFNVDYLAMEVGMSAPILYKKLKAVTNLSVNNFVKQYRLKKACQLLKSDKNISEIAYAVGFSDRKYFSREFKKQFGVNPSEYNEKTE